MRSFPLVALAFITLSAGDLAAQAVHPIQTGDRVRIAAAARSGTYTVAAVEDTALLLSGSGAAPLRIPVGSIERLDVSRGRRSAGRGALRGAGIGFAAGAGVGAVAGFASGDDAAAYCFICFSREEKALLGGVVLGVGGAALGLIIGIAAPGERWERISLPARVSVVPARAGRVGLAVSTSF